MGGDGSVWMKAPMRCPDRCKCCLEFGATDDVVRQNFNIGINSEILEDPAT